MLRVKVPRRWFASGEPRTLGPPETLQGRQRRLSVPKLIARPDYATRANGRPRVPDSIELKDAEWVARLERTCTLAAETLALAGRVATAGATTADINRALHRHIIREGAYPSPLGYFNFPASVCTSVNNVLVHGIPSDAVVLRNGDVVSVDVTVFREGVHGDTAASFVVGDSDAASASAVALVAAARAARDAGVAACAPGAPFSAIADAIAESLNKSNASLNRPDGRRLVVCDDFCGHGIGRHFHEAPLVRHAPIITPDAVTHMLPGMAFTVEPVVCWAAAGSDAPHDVWPDGWTVSTRSGFSGAQFEHTVLIGALAARPLT